MTTLPQACIVLIGAGYWGSKILNNLHSMGMLYGYVDDAIQHPTVRRISLEDALRNPQITGVAIATPSHTHAALIEQCLRHNKHVFVEKPFCLELQQADHLAALAQSLHKILMIGYLMMFHPATQAIKNMFADATLHDCHSILIQRQDLLTPRNFESVWWDLAVHDLSMLLAIFHSVPEHKNHITHRMPHSCYDSLHYHGVIHGPFQTIDIHISTSWLSPIKASTWTLCTSEDLWVFRSDREYELLHYPTIRHTRHPQATTIPLDVVPSLKQECQHFVDCITHNRTPHSDHSLTRDIMRWLDEIEQLHPKTPS